ncbi:hypothetical protein [Vibrio anguillarum]|uniref:Uncharacterized protein n=14 Tax=Vibrio anguillarum TaxID=55601 RepID=A0AAW4AE89_VIBAN|nr:hypothetical protein [Vibrio anguillarum]AOT26220.1 hypothetical protein Her_0091 [Vibrio phage Her]AOT26311.1 hypothetical protein CLA_0091 [Vibrio phage Cla]AOT26493.1 hypothetical protein Pel_0091 [Vibrio phage Pel]AOT26584.1 hypothetical protein pVa2_0090 [Vibrio phage pVa-2]AOT26675.1 hypothetical protein pVa1_0091 [Vibrio phage pVa-1]AOT26766.1 hypothetical protein pVa5_0091 [Vibrio phage vB_VspP_pVa5_12Jun]AOT26857.1 hypothetical protein pVa6_0091 [Vibrio phage pVa-6]AOT27044.1 hy
MGYETTSRTDMHFGIKTNSADVIDRNGKYLLNNYTTSPEIKVTPEVDYIELGAWDSAMSITEYSTILLPQDVNGGTHLKVNYKTNNPITLFRHKNHGTESERYNWYLVYSGFEDYRVTLPTTVGGTYDINAGFKSFHVNVPLNNISNQYYVGVDDSLRLAVQRVGTSSGSHNVGLCTTAKSWGVQFTTNMTGAQSIYKGGNLLTTATAVDWPLGSAIASTNNFVAELFVNHSQNSNDKQYRRYRFLGERTVANSIVMKVECWIWPDMYSQ